MATARPILQRPPGPPLSGGYRPSPAPPITTTGIRGYLLWLKREQPAVYAKLAPALPTIAPSAFSHYMGSAITRTRKLAGVGSLRARNGVVLVAGLGRLGQSADDLDPVYSDVDLSYSTDPDLTNYTIAQGASNPEITNAPTPETTAAANTGAGTPSTQVAAIGALATGITGLAITGMQLSTANEINQLQLQRAQAGLAPLNIGMNANGVPTITGTGLSGSGMLIVLLIAGLVLFAAMGERRQG